MRRFFRYLLLGLALVLVAMASALTAMRFAIHGREVPVPKVTGLTPAQAEAALNPAGLVLNIDNKFYSAEAPEGRILSQLPAAGTQVRRGWRVRVAQSLGPQRTEIPSVVGESARAAEINIGRRGLELAGIAQTEIPGAPAEQVAAQSPPANASNVASPKISLLVSAPVGEQQFVMPSFIGKKLADATEQLNDAGFQLGKITEIEVDGMPVVPGGRVLPAPAGIIVKQLPAPGQKVTAGSAISFEVTK